MLQTLDTSHVAGLIWNDATCDCLYLHPHLHGVPLAGETQACDACLIETWNDKVSELSDNFIDSVADKGMLSPILLSEDGTRVMNGHHRLAVAIMLMLETIPVIYTWDDDNADERHDLPFSYEC